ncbi:hypothetical protein E4K65_45875 [Bradyrhizobium niftali]|uniref:Uncharacterized protein n=1 Tax=Bradyrhizobium niftali TaxID=2560055 RepID=A0A4Y9L1M4_9BRAD|nr:hypothetical protein E4K65_45875 [Bradyrhizobium niftali]
MEPGSVVEALEEGEDIAPSLGAGPILPMMNELGLEGVEEALHRSIVVAVGALRLIHAVTPATARAARYLCEAYWADSSGRRNTDYVHSRQQLVKRFCRRFQPRVFLDRALRAAATAAISSALWMLRSVPFGKY